MSAQLLQATAKQYTAATRCGLLDEARGDDGSVDDAALDIFELAQVVAAVEDDLIRVWYREAWLAVPLLIVAARTPFFGQFSLC